VVEASQEGTFVGRTITAHCFLQIILSSLSNIVHRVLSLLQHGQQLIHDTINLANVDEVVMKADE
jgi:hypothetical protein